MNDIANEREYHLAVHRIFELMQADPAPDTSEGEELARLVAAVDRFEDERFPMSCCAFAVRDSIARLLTLLRALGAFYDIEQAVRWCESPQPLLDGQRPVDLMFSEKGAAEMASALRALERAAQPPAPVAPTWTCPNCETADEFTVTHHGPDDVGAVYPVMICRICDTTVSDYRAEQIRASCQKDPSVRLAPRGRMIQTEDNS